MPPPRIQVTVAMNPRGFELKTRISAASRTTGIPIPTSAARSFPGMAMYGYRKISNGRRA